MFTVSWLRSSRGSRPLPCRLRGWGRHIRSPRTRGPQSRSLRCSWKSMDRRSLPGNEIKVYIKAWLPFILHSDVCYDQCILYHNYVFPLILKYWDIFSNVAFWNTTISQWILKYLILVALMTCYCLPGRNLYHWGRRFRRRPFLGGGPCTRSSRSRTSCQGWCTSGSGQGCHLSINQWCHQMSEIDC